MKKSDDKISQAILRELRRNARISWQELGRAVHLSGQAAAERVRQMQDAGVINGCGKRSGCLHFLCQTTFVFCWNDGFVIFEHSQERCGFAVPFGILDNPQKSQNGSACKKRKV
ncbi:Lrp/AsnC family transcriptional regulator [Neisseria dentiae]|uniref:Lrp/AsnC family transcriptional regulator n=1 Tax=Neisseria dentiae TaxID=194197 RepID=UPI00211C7EEF|nr:AsnC family protein [Neisseria dentiae]MCQ9327236.1 AsnC family protein [Neisseria dentiae]